MLMIIMIVLFQTKQRIIIFHFLIVSLWLMLNSIRFNFSPVHGNRNRSETIILNSKLLITNNWYLLLPISINVLFVKCFRTDTLVFDNDPPVLFCLCLCAFMCGLTGFNLFINYIIHNAFRGFNRSRKKNNNNYCAMQCLQSEIELNSHGNAYRCLQIKYIKFISNMFCSYRMNSTFPVCLFICCSVSFFFVWKA